MDSLGTVYSHGLYESYLFISFNFFLASIYSDGQVTNLKRTFNDSKMFLLHALLISVYNLASIYHLWHHFTFFSRWSISRFHREQKDFFHSINPDLILSQSIYNFTFWLSDNSNTLARIPNSLSYLIILSFTSVPCSPFTLPLSFLIWLTSPSSSSSSLILSHSF